MRIAAGRRVVWGGDGGFDSADRRSVRVAGRSFEIATFGRGEPIILVPGMAGGSRLLASLARALARSHRVFLYDYRDEHDPLTVRSARGIGDHARDLIALIGELGLERPTVLGVSFGGAVALEAAVDHPGRLGRLIVSGVEARFRSTLGATIARRVLERFPLPADNPFVNQFFNLFHGGKPSDPAVARFLVERCWETDQGVMARRIALLDSFDVEDRLWRLDLPTLVVAGARDVVVPPLRQQRLARSIAGARFEEIAEAGHVAFLTHPVEVARQVARLRRGHRPSVA